MISDTYVGQDHGTLYHLIQTDLWQQAKASGQPYFPPTYEAVSWVQHMPLAPLPTAAAGHTATLSTAAVTPQDGFIHLTKEANLLLGVANHFYKSVQGDFLVLAIDSKQLSSKVSAWQARLRPVSSWRPLCCDLCSCVGCYLQVVFEDAAPVGNTEAMQSKEVQQFPHLVSHWTHF